MRMDGLAFFQLYHLVTGVLGMLLNVLLLYVSVFKSPTTIRTYSILIINFAIADAACAFLALFIEQRIIPAELSMIHISYGVCHYLGPTWCYAGYSIMLHFCTHSQYSMLISFSYRYYVLFNGSPKPKKLILVLVLFYIPSFVQCIAFLTTQGDQAETLLLLRKNFPTYKFDVRMVSGNNNVLAPASLFTILHVCIPSFPIYILIFILTSKIKRKLQQSTEHLRKETKLMHRQLLKALTYQSLLPVFFALSISMYLIEQSKLVIHPAIECSIYSVITVIPCLSPAIYLYYVAPYRRAVVALFKAEKVSTNSSGPQSLVNKRKSMDVSNILIR